MSTTVAEVVGTVVPGAEAAHRLGTMLFTRARGAIVRHQVLKDCELLPELIEADADNDTLSYLPYLLAWDLNRVIGPQADVAVFLDEFESVGGQENRQVERWLQRSVFLMPNVLFVVTGRNRLDWAELSDAHALDFVGKDRWPHLQAEHSGHEPRQHLVGYLSDKDADSYLASALTNDGAAAMTAAIRERIVAASSGFPLYLDLAVTTWLDIQARGKTPTESDFGEPLPAVVSRMIRDLDKGERDLLRAAALLDRFDLDVLRSACPWVPDSLLRRFRNRPFLELDREKAIPYSLHQVLRHAIRDADTDLPDSWSVRERNEVAGRISTHLEHRAAQSKDRAVQLGTFEQAVGLAAVTDQFFDWLLPTAQTLLLSGNWAIAPSSVDTDSDAVTAFRQALRGAGERRSGNQERAIELLESAQTFPDLPNALRQFIMLHYAHALRVAGRYAEGAEYYDSLRHNGVFAADATYWLADYTYLAGRFQEALDLLDELTSPSAELHGEILRLRGHIDRVNALFDTAEGHYRDALALARKHANLAAEGKALTDLMQTLAWTRPTDALALRDDAIAINTAIHNRVELVKIHAATAVAHGSRGEPDVADGEAQAGLELTESCGYPGGRIWCIVARIHSQLPGSGAADTQESANTVANIAAELGGNRFWGEIVSWWTGTTDTDQTRWLDGKAAAQQRWQDLRRTT